MKRHRHVNILSGDLARIHPIKDQTDKPTLARITHGDYGPALELEVKPDGRFEVAFVHADKYAVHYVLLLSGRLDEHHVDLSDVPTPVLSALDHVRGPDGEYYLTPRQLPATAEVRGERRSAPDARELGETGHVGVLSPDF